jgi:hypothetical protein
MAIEGIGWADILSAQIAAWLQQRFSRRQNHRN